MPHFIQRNATTVTRAILRAIFLTQSETLLQATSIAQAVSRLSWCLLVKRPNEQMAVASSGRGPSGQAIAACAEPEHIK